MKTEKPIYFSAHARVRMLLRGAGENEVVSAIRSAKWEATRQGKFHSRSQFDFDKPSPINRKFYRYKTVDVIFADEPDKIVVITVKVYYHN